MEKYSYDNLDENGYLVVENTLPKEDCDFLAKSIQNEILDLIFTRQGFDIDTEDPDTPRLLVDQRLRVEKLGEKARGCVWRKGCTLNPIFTKSTGMVDCHFIPDVMKKIIFNKKLYKISAKINGTEKLAFTTGPERVSLKPKGATDMPQHIDSNLFHEEVNYPFRIQSLIVLQNDTEIKTRDSGTLCVIPYFHLYWNFASRIFHPVTGIKGYRFPPNNSRFFKLPTGKIGFDKYFLPFLRKCAKEYAEFLEGNKESDYLKYFKKYKKDGITVPPNSKGYLEKLDWTPIKLKPGDFVFWHQHLPHRSLRNKSDIPRIVAYHNLFPVTEEWYGSEEQKWVARQFRRGEFYYGVNNGRYPTHIVNIEEHEKLVEEGKIEKISKISKKTSLRRKLTGRENWYQYI